ncbi:MAG: helix-turn-helix transcriptional regulator [Candidatus Omnitrophica bacterium]|nr:helix-turn-helix transcriptional regulator [Candidatus Omnitrophota bacterium]
MNISKYFWDLNRKSLRGVKKVLRDPNHPDYARRMVALLSRCDSPRELFSVVAQKEFIRAWPKIRSHWVKMSRQSDFRDWWETIYEQLIEKYRHTQKKSPGRMPDLYRKVGMMLKEARLEMGLSQRQLAQIAGMKQPDISRIEEGRKNITLYTLMRLCKIIKIKRINLG